MVKRRGLRASAGGDENGARMSSPPESEVWEGEVSGMWALVLGKWAWGSSHLSLNAQEHRQRRDPSWR